VLFLARSLIISVELSIDLLLALFVKWTKTSIPLLEYRITARFGRAMQFFLLAISILQNTKFTIRCTFLIENQSSLQNFAHLVLFVDAKHISCLIDLSSLSGNAVLVLLDDFVGFI